MDSKEIRVQIDNDTGLQSKRKLLIVVSLILLALSFSGAKIEEANTFIFKIKFTNQNGLGVLLVLSIVFLMIRYYNYAKPFHNKLLLIWSKNLLRRPIFKSHPTDPFEDDGLIVNSFDAELASRFPNKLKEWDCSYETKFFLSRHLVHGWLYVDEDENIAIRKSYSVSIYRHFGTKTYLLVLFFESKERINMFFTSREYLDIKAPYFIALLAIASYYFNAELRLILDFFTPSK